MRLSGIFTGILLVIILSCTNFPIESRNGAAIQTINLEPKYSNSDTNQLSETPYVWQEIGGFSLWSALTMAIQYVGVDIDLYDLFAVSGTGFSALYSRSGSDMSFFPGIFLHQIQIGTSTSELLGLDTEYYIDATTEEGADAVRVLQERGVEIVALMGEEDAWDLMRSTINVGYPLVLSVDPYHLPPEDYDILRQHNLIYEKTGVGHAVLLVGYNDTAEVAYIMDPGVGTFGENYGYPQEDSWSYNITYGRLNLAWEPLLYSAVCVMPGNGPPDDFSLKLGDYICDRLLGNRTSYFQGYESFYFLSVGTDAFRGMSLDMTREGLTWYLEEFQAKELALRILGNQIEVGMTLQYSSYRTALESLPNLMPDIDLNHFLEAGREALPHMEVLSHNSSLIDPTGSSSDSLLFTTFNGIADTYEANLNLNAALDEYSEEIEEISDHLLEIADSWKSAGELLSSVIDRTQQTLLGQLIIITAGVCVIIVVAVIIVRKRGR